MRYSTLRQLQSLNFDNQIQPASNMNKDSIGELSSLRICDTTLSNRGLIMRTLLSIAKSNLNMETQQHIAMSGLIPCPAPRPILPTAAGHPDQNMTKKRCTSSGTIVSISRRNGRRSKNASIDSLPVAIVQREIPKGSNASSTVS
jgi:hypothetical protein